jgi:hypothetical protein
MSFLAVYSFINHFRKAVKNIISPRYEARGNSVYLFCGNSSGAFFIYRARRLSILLNTRLAGSSLGREFRRQNSRPLSFYIYLAMSIN